MKPLFLKIENFFSHKDSEVDFNNFNSALLLGSIDGDYTKSNGSGKSAILESILWCLFNKSRAAQMDDVIHWGENRAQVTFEFLHDNKTYRVKRIRFRATSTSTVDFLVLSDEGKWIPLSGSTSGDTNEKIVSTIKLDHKTFINSVYFRQNDISEFALSEASRKKEILKSIVDISKWDDFEKESKKRLKKAQQDLSIAQASIDSLSQETSNLASHSIRMKEVEENISQLKTELDSTKKEVEYLSELYVTKKSELDTDRWDRVTAEIVSLKKRGAELKKSYDASSENLNDLVSKRDSIISKISAINSKILATSIDENIEERFEKVKSEISDYSSILNSALEKQKELSKIHLIEGECYVCANTIDSYTFKRISDEHNKKAEFTKSKVDNAKSRLNFLSEEKKDILAQLETKAKLKLITEELPVLEYKKSHMDEEIGKLKILKDEMYEELVGIKNQIWDSEKIIASLNDENFKNIMMRLKNKKEEESALSANLMKLSVDLGSLREKASAYLEKKSQLDLERKKLLIKQDKVSCLDKMSKMFGKNGIQTILLNAVISDLEIKSNTILETISQDTLSISLETQRQGSDGVSVVETLDLNVKKDGSICNFYSLSGGEQFRIALALRIALSEIASNHGGSSLEFLLLDEINSPLDKSGVETLFVNVIKTLESKYKMLVITHDDSLKERFENIIEVQKVNGESSTIFTSR
jgi:exonuclease SbcC